MYPYDNLLCYHVLNCFHRIVERKCLSKPIIVLRNHFKRNDYNKIHFNIQYYLIPTYAYITLFFIVLTTCQLFCKLSSSDEINIYKNKQHSQSYIFRIYNTDVRQICPKIIICLNFFSCCETSKRGTIFKVFKKYINDSVHSESV